MGPDQTSKVSLPNTDTHVFMDIGQMCIVVYLCYPCVLHHVSYIFDHALFI